MIDESIGFFWRLSCIILRGVVELGFEIGLRVPGLFVQKVLWPPNWASKVEEGPVTYGLGIVFYVAVAVLLFLYRCD